MNSSSISDEFLILRECAAAATNEWSPREFAARSGWSEEQVMPAVRQLQRLGLIDECDQSGTQGRRYRVTSLGEQALRDPTLLAQIQGRLTSRRNAARLQFSAHVETPNVDEAQRPWATWALLALCLISFLLAGRIALAGRWENLRWFLLMGDPHAQDVLGAVSAAAIEEGEWWRLLATLFVHQDFFHLLINLSTFFGYGRRVEQLWGSWRFTLIYLFAGLTGAAAALGYDPSVRVIGSSASISGILLSAAAWFLLNSRRLSPEAARAGVRQSLLAFVWLMGWWALLSWLGGTKFPWVFFLGGAVAGAILALPLHAQMAVQSPTRWAFVVLTPLVPLVGVTLILRTKVRGEPNWADAVAQAKAARERQAQNAQQREQRGQEQEEYDRFNQELMPGILKGDRFYEKRWNEIAELARTPPAARLRQQIDQARQDLGEVRSEIATALEKLRRAPAFTVDRVETAARAARRYLEDLDDLFQATEQALARGSPWDESLDEKAEQTSRSARNFNRSLRGR